MSDCQWILVLAAAPAGARDTDTCTGSLNDFPAHVGVLSGIHAGNVQINGACVVNAGPTEVKGNLTVLPGSALLATFGETNFEPGSPASTLTVDGSVSVQSGGTLLLGCFATSFACLDDPNQDAPTLNSHERGWRGLRLVRARDHRARRRDRRNVSENGGGGGFTCNPEGIFAVFGSPVYTTTRTPQSGVDVITNMRSCWLGVARVQVWGSAYYRTTS